MNVITFNRDQVIFRQGSFANSMYDITAGKVGVYTDYDTDSQKLLAVLEAGQTLGEMGMLEVYPRSATAVAQEDGTVLVEITEDELSDYFRNKPEKLLAIMKLLSQRIRETNEKYIDACRAVYEKDEADRTGSEPNPWLAAQVAAMCQAFQAYTAK